MNQMRPLHGALNFDETDVSRCGPITAEANMV